GPSLLRWRNLRVVHTAEHIPDPQARDPFAPAPPPGEATSEALEATSSALGHPRHGSPRWPRAQPLIGSRVPPRASGLPYGSSHAHLTHRSTVPYRSTRTARSR